MKRRIFGLLAGTSLASLGLGWRSAKAADASLLTTTLTSVGAERAGNADGSIPAWTGGYTTVPAGWQDGAYMPDPFMDDKSTLTINASNMSQYAGKLTDGVMAMMTKYGFSINVYPTRRTAAAPQWVYDNVAKNASTAALTAPGGRSGFNNAYGGIPFPIPDSSNPLDAGAQIIWNHENRWGGSAYTITTWTYATSNGQISLSGASPCKFDVPYYHQNGDLASFNGLERRYLVGFVAPPSSVGEEIIQWEFTAPGLHPDQSWELLNGQGRVRRTPDLFFDTPTSESNGIANYDEYFGFNGSIEKYDWKYLGKKELYVPYNNNGIYQHKGRDVHLAHFLDPSIVRWELHRVWIVEATLHPGERNVLARRRFFVDEDTWMITSSDSWDANNTLYRVSMIYNYLRPDLPGVILGGESMTNLQTDNYVTANFIWDEKAHPTIKFLDSYPSSLFDPQNMAATGQY